MLAARRMRACIGFWRVFQGDLPRAIAAEGGAAVAPLIAEVIAQGRAQCHFACDDLVLACETFPALLIGDLRIRRTVGRLPQLDAAARAARAATTLRQFHILFGVVAHLRPEA